MALKKIFDAFQNSTDAQVASLRIFNVIYLAHTRGVLCVKHLDVCMVYMSGLPWKAPARQLGNMPGIANS